MASVPQTYEVGREIEVFHANVQALAKSYRVENVCEDGYLITPSNHTPTSEQLDIDFTVMAITHGNETAGLAAVNEWLSQLAYSWVKLPIRVAVLLGNVPAAKAGVRYLERDLNRSFARTGPLPTWEEKRAAELGRVMARSRYFLDLHQTTEDCSEPFFIFPYTKRGYHFARSISCSTRIVTHWGKPFSEDGCCSDEFVNRHGGAGISLELGQNSFHPLHIAAGLRACFNAVEAVVTPDSKHRKAYHPGPGAGGKIYTWAKVWPYPEASQVSLKEGLANFTLVRAEEIVGEADGKPLVSDVEGYVLFPQYRRDKSKPPSAELMRLLRLVSEAELPEGGV